MLLFALDDLLLRARGLGARLAQRRLERGDRRLVRVAATRVRGGLAGRVHARQINGRAPVGNLVLRECVSLHELGHVLVERRNLILLGRNLGGGRVEARLEPLVLGDARTLHFELARDGRQTLRGGRLALAALRQLGQRGLQRGTEALGVAAVPLDLASQALGQLLALLAHVLGLVHEHGVLFALQHNHVLQARVEALEVVALALALAALLLRGRGHGGGVHGRGRGGGRVADQRGGHAGQGLLRIGGRGG